MSSKSILIPEPNERIYELLSQNELEKAIKELLSYVADASNERIHLREALDISETYYQGSLAQKSPKASPLAHSWPSQKELLQRIFNLLNALEAPSIK